MEAPVSQSLRVSRIHLAAWADTVLWRAMAFARSLHRYSPWAAKQLRRLLLLLWWTVTLQLHTHARYWLRARRLRRIAPPSPPDIQPIETVDPGQLRIPRADN